MCKRSSKTTRFTCIIHVLHKTNIIQKFLQLVTKNGGSEPNTSQNERTERGVTQ